MFDQGRGFERGEGEVNCHPFDGIFKHICYRQIHRILTFYTSGDTWPAAFYLSFNSDFYASKIMHL